MAEYKYEEIDGVTYAVPIDPKPRKKAPPLIVVMNDHCTACSGSPMCMTECPVDCIHPVFEGERPVRVWVDNDICIGCMNCLSYDVRPKNILGPALEANCEELNHKDLSLKNGVCPWDAIELHPFDRGAARSTEFYPQPDLLAEAAKPGE